MSRLILFIASLWCIQSVKMDPKRWMGQLPPATRIHQINIPGTHESMAFTGGKFAKCLDYTILEQLYMGYRFFDIRVKYKYSSGLSIFHGSLTDMGVTWKNLHNDMKVFLAAYPSECVILKVKQVSGLSETFSYQFRRRINKYNNDAAHGNDIYYFGGAGNLYVVPRIQDCQGKAVILGDGPWTKLGPWQNLFPLRWIDHNEGKGNDEITWKRSHKRLDSPTGRYMKWQAALDRTTAHEQTVPNPHADPPETQQQRDRTFYRNGIQANSLSATFNMKKQAKNKGFRNGTPLQWAEIVNKSVWKRIRDLSFPPAGAGHCHDRFYGIIQVDLPSKASQELYPREIAAVVIMSNCHIYNLVSLPSRKDWSDLQVVNVLADLAAYVEKENMMGSLDEDEKLYDYQLYDDISEDEEDDYFYDDLFDDDDEEVYELYDALVRLYNALN